MHKNIEQKAISFITRSKKLGIGNYLNKKRSLIKAPQLTSYSIIKD